MSAVGIDVSKIQSIFSIMRPFDKIVSIPFQIEYTTSDMNSLLELINFLIQIFSSVPLPKTYQKL